MSPSAVDQTAATAGSWWRTPRLAGRFAFHPVTFLVFVVPVSIGSVVLDGATTGAALNDSLVASVGGALVAALVFFGLGALVGALLPSASLPRTAIVLALFGLTEVTRTSVVGLILHTQYSIEVVSADRFLSAALTGIALLGTVSIVINDREEFRRAYLTLSEQRAQLQSALVFLDRTVVDFVDDLQRAVRHTVDRALQPVIDSVHSGATADTVVGAIVDVSQSVIRPLSHELRQATQPDEFERRDTGKVPNPSFRKVLHFMSIEEPFRPGAISVTIALLFLSASLFRLPFPEGLGLLVVIVGLGAATHWLARRFLLPAMLRWPSTLRATVVGLVYIVPFVLPVVVLFILRDGQLDADRFPTLVYLLVIVEVVSWALATVPALRRAREDVLSELETTTRSLAETRARVALRVRRERTRLASVLHGDIQGWLMATALQLSQNPDGKEGAQDLLEDVRHRLLDHLDQSGSAYSVGFLHEIHDAVKGLWEGLVEISWVVDEAVYPVIDLHPDTREAIDQVIREAITNAVKHGQSRRVTVSISLEDDALVLVHVEDEGRGLGERREPGSGERLFEAVTRDYRITDTGSGTRLEARIPLSLLPRGVAVA